MIYTLKADQLEIRVDSLGAQLQSIIGPNSYEYIWQGDPAYWTGRSPILFPIIGGLPGGKYSWQGQIYEMGSHGFARQAEFAVTRHTDRSLELKISDSEATRAQYPFALISMLLTPFKAIP